MKVIGAHYCHLEARDRLKNDSLENLRYQQHITAWQCENAIIYRRNIFPLRAPHKATPVSPWSAWQKGKMKRTGLLKQQLLSPTWKAQPKYGKSTWKKRNCSCREGWGSGAQQLFNWMEGRWALRRSKTRADGTEILQISRTRSLGSWTDGGDKQTWLLLFLVAKHHLEVMSTSSGSQTCETSNKVKLSTLSDTSECNHGCCP